MASNPYKKHHWESIFNGACFHVTIALNPASVLYIEIEVCSNKFSSKVENVSNNPLIGKRCVLFTNHNIKQKDLLCVAEIYHPGISDMRAEDKILTEEDIKLLDTYKKNFITRYSRYYGEDIATEMAEDYYAVGNIDVSSYGHLVGPFAERGKKFLDYIVNEATVTEVIGDLDLKNIADKYLESEIGQKVSNIEL